jgi:hypothetical protein
MATTEPVPGPDAQGLAPAPEPRAPATVATPIGLGGLVLGGYALFGLADAIGSAIQMGVRLEAPWPRLVHLAFAWGYHLGAAFLVLLAAALLRPFRRRWGQTALYVGAFLCLIGVIHVLFESDLGHFPALLRWSIEAALALSVPLGLIAWRLVRHLRFVWLVAFATSIGAVVANHAALRLNYPGFHVLVLLLGGGAMVLSLDALPWTWVRRRVALLDGAAAQAVLASLAAAALALPPSAKVAVELAADETTSAYHYLSSLRVAARARARPSIAGRDEVAAVPPTEPPLVDGGKLTVLLVTIDSFRHDAYFGTEHLAEMPNLRRMAESAYVFTDARTPSTSTVGTLASVFAARPFSSLCWQRVEFEGWRPFFPTVDESPRFPQLLTDAGVSTFTVPTTSRLLQRYRSVSGFAKEAPVKITKRHVMADVSIPPLLGWLRTDRSQRRFGFVHLMDAHIPYDLGGEHGTERERFLRELGVVDQALGKIFDTLDAREAWDHTVLIVTGDHGEAFGEHNRVTHGGPVYDVLVRVPLFIRLPGHVGRLIDQRVSLLDLGPTILDLFGREAPGLFTGRSLLPLIDRRADAEPRPIAMESIEGDRGLVFPDGMKVIVNAREGRVELYDLSKDPGELDNLIDEHPAAEALVEDMYAWYAPLEARGVGCFIPGG